MENPQTASLSPVERDMDTSVAENEIVEEEIEYIEESGDEIVEEEVDDEVEEEEVVEEEVEEVVDKDVGKADKEVVEDEVIEDEIVEEDTPQRKVVVSRKVLNRRSVSSEPRVQGNKTPTSQKRKVSQTAKVVSSSPATPVIGKVRPTTAVKEHLSKAPSPAGSPTPPTNVNTFESFNKWDAINSKGIKITFPKLVSKDEVTVEAIKLSHPDERYWGRDVVFTYGTHLARFIKLEKIPVPYISGERYGNNFVYIGLPLWLREKLVESGKSVRRVLPDENRLEPNNRYWWKAINKFDGKIGFAHKDSPGEFIPKSVNDIFQTTGNGFLMNVQIAIRAKCSSEERKPLSATTPFTLGVRLLCGWIQDINVVTLPPTRVANDANVMAPIACTSDFGSDALAAKMSALGL